VKFWVVSFFIVSIGVSSWADDQLASIVGAELEMPAKQYQSDGDEPRRQEVLVIGDRVRNFVQQNDYRGAARVLTVGLAKRDVVFVISALNVIEQIRHAGCPDSELSGVLVVPLARILAYGVDLRGRNPTEAIESRRRTALRNTAWMLLQLIPDFRMQYPYHQWSQEIRTNIYRLYEVECDRGIPRFAAWLRAINLYMQAPAFTIGRCPERFIQPLGPFPY
jgi:hypothetical protein